MHRILGRFYPTSWRCVLQLWPIMRETIVAFGCDLNNMLLIYKILYAWITRIFSVAVTVDNIWNIVAQTNDEQSLDPIGSDCMWTYAKGWIKYVHYRHQKMSVYRIFDFRPKDGESITCTVRSVHVQYIAQCCILWEWRLCTDAQWYYVLISNVE
jgi:hypothetical protein